MRELKPFLDIINKHKDKIEQEKNTFNIFYELDIEHKETVLHSKFIAYLLNLNSNHKMGSKFLDSFFEICKLSDVLKSQNNRFDISIEHFIGAVNNDTEEGGRIDILIENNEYCIAIENKIYAGFQPKQLERYKSFLLEKANKKKCYLVLLTLYNNSNADYVAINNEFEKHGEGLNFKHISYSNEISVWINAIIDSINNNKLNSNELHSILRQYNESIKRLCNKTSNKKMEEELINNIISDENSLRVYHQMLNISEEDIWYRIVHKHLLDKLNNTVINNKKLVRSESILNSNSIIGPSEILFHTNITDRSTKEFDILFVDEVLLKKNLIFGFEWNQSNWNLEYGLKYIDPTKADLVINDDYCKQLKAELGLGLLKSTNEELWYGDKIWDEHKEWSNRSTETLINVISGNVYKDIVELLKKIF